MPDIMLILACLSQSVDGTSVRRLGRIVEALLAMPGRVTLLGLSRWTERGGSYRTVQRFFNTTLAWGQIHWLIIRHHLMEAEEVLLLGADEVIVTKAGKHTYGLDRFFASLYGKTVPGLGFLSLSLLRVKRRCAYPLRLEPVLKATVSEPPAAVKPHAKGQRGRPKGSRNRNRRDVTLSPYLGFVQGLIRQVLALIGRELKVVYLVFDGAFGHNDALQMVRQTGLHLISKLRHEAAWYFPYEGLYAGRGPRRQYGAKLDYRQIPARYRQASSRDNHIQTTIYQMPMWHKRFADRLNIVVVVKTNLRTGASAHVVLFSSDPTRSSERLIDYYRLRFQIEFTFRDAKPYWGLEDFMVVNSTPVYNSANLAMLMVNLSQILIRACRAACPECGIQDLKARFRGRKYVLEALTWLPQMPEPIIINQLLEHVTDLGRIHQPEKAA